MLAVPTFVGSAVSRKCVGSPLVNVSVGFAGVEGGAAPRLMLPCATTLLPTMGAFKLIAGAVTVVTICSATFDGVKYPVGVARFKLVVPAVPGTKLVACV